MFRQNLMYQLMEPLFFFYPSLWILKLGLLCTKHYFVIFQARMVDHQVSAQGTCSEPWPIYSVAREVFSKNFMWYSLTEAWFHHLSVLFNRWEKSRKTTKADLKVRDSSLISDTSNIPYRNQGNSFMPQ